MKFSLLLVSMRWCWWLRLVLLRGVMGRERLLSDEVAASGVGNWVDVTTPRDAMEYRSSRGHLWKLVMSDEFTNNRTRDFRAGGDHLWTSLEKPDGVNAALQLYSHNLTSILCDKTHDPKHPYVCSLQLKVVDEVNTVRVYNMYKNPPGYQSATFFYRSAMVQTWNKFCFQGGMLEVRAKLPGAMSERSGNPDLVKGLRGHVTNLRYYPTWPGIWLMGNLGRAIFSASTNRMWPFSYNKCDPLRFDPKNQRISACDGEPGSGLNAFQGRGAPEIDLLEGGGTDVSASIQLAPGLPNQFRVIPVDEKLENGACKYSGSCKTPGANAPDVPTVLYKRERRAVKSWYHGLRYSANNLCEPNGSMVQQYSAIKHSLDNGIAENSCNDRICPASHDVNSNLDIIDGNSEGIRWGINSRGTCFAKMNAYMGSYLCDPDNQDTKCSFPRDDSKPSIRSMKPFNYQMDAISANYGLHVGAYKGFQLYQIEWVTGSDGYIRWMLNGMPVFEIPAVSVTTAGKDPRTGRVLERLLPEEPMYLIINVAVSPFWGAQPPNPGRPCRGNGADPVANHICDDFPMFLQIDHVRLYQDVSKNSSMVIGCDPETHPTAQWIEEHLEEYEDADNKVVRIAGGATCVTDADCFPQMDGKLLRGIGQCSKGRCVCRHRRWGGPRCTTSLGSLLMQDGPLWQRTHGPPFAVSILVALTVFGIVLIVWWQFSLVKKQKALAAALDTSVWTQKRLKKHQNQAVSTPHRECDDTSEWDYDQNQD